VRTISNKKPAPKKKKIQPSTPYNEPHTRKLKWLPKIIAILAAAMILTLIIANINYYSGGTFTIFGVAWNWGTFALVFLIAFLFPIIYGLMRKMMNNTNT